MKKETKTCSCLDKPDAEIKRDGTIYYFENFSKKYMTWKSRIESLEESVKLLDRRYNSQNDVIDSINYWLKITGAGFMWVCVCYSACKFFHII